MSRSRRIVFIDVDGTLIDADERMSRSSVQAVRLARANGHLVFVCTGRGHREVYPAIRDIGFDGTISAGGGFAEVGGELVIARTMPIEVTARMVAFYEDAGYDYYLQAYDALYPSPRVVDRYVGYFGADRLHRAEPRPDMFPVVSADDHHPLIAALAATRRPRFDGIAKSGFLADDLTAFDRVVEAFGDEFHVITGTVPHMGNGSGEVTLAGVNKGTTIVQLLDLLGMHAASAIGIGDSMNDIEMLEVCGVGIAMGNASPTVQSHADEVTSSVADNGVWNAFARHGLL